MQTEEELELLKKWLKRYLASERYCENFFENGRECYRLYKSYKTSAEKVYKHDIFVPYSFALMEDATAYMMLSLLASPVTFGLQPRWSSVSPELCIHLEQVINWVLTEEETEFPLELEELIKNVNLYGTSYLINYPKVDDDANFVRLHLTSPSSLSIFPEPGLKRLSRMTWAIKKSKEDLDVLRRYEKKGEYKNIDDTKGGSTDTDEVSKLLQEVGISTGQEHYDQETGKVEVLDCMFGGDVITIGGRRAIIRDTTKKPQRPYIYNFPMLDCRLTGSPGEFFGVSLLESFRPTQKELNVLRSQRRDNVALQLNKLFVYDIMAGEVDLDTLFSAPGNVIVTTNRDALEELPISDITRSSYQEEEALKYDIQNITSLWDYGRGATPQRKETATGIMRLQQASQGRQEWLLRKLDTYILQPLCKRILVYIREYLPKEDFIRITGDPRTAGEFYSLSLKDIRRCIQIQPITESIQSIKEIDLQAFLQAFDRLIPLPDVNRVALIKQLLYKLNQRNIKEILPQLSQQGQDATAQGMEEIVRDSQMKQDLMGGGSPNSGKPMPGMM